MEFCANLRPAQRANLCRETKTQHTVSFGDLHGGAQACEQGICEKALGKREMVVCTLCLRATVTVN